MRKLIRFLSLRFLEDPNSIRKKDNISRKRTKMIFSILFVFFFIWIIIFNIGQMTILGTIRGHNLGELAEKKYKIDSIVEPNRGKIFDRNGNILADNSNSYKLIAILSDKASEGIAAGKTPKHVVDTQKTAEELSKYIDMEERDIKDILTNTKAYQVEFGSKGKDIDVDTKKKIEELKLPGIIFATSTKRYYPNGSLLGNFLGFAQSSGDDNLLVGRLGIEKVFDYYLRGKNGRIIYAKDAWGNVVSNEPTVKIDPVDGADIYLTIDKNIQSYIDNNLSDIQKKYNPETAFAIAVSAKTGEILGIGQTPAFNPNTKENIDSAWTNAIYNSAVEPGSTMKTFTLSIMIENGIYDPNKTYLSGSYRVQDAVIYDYNKVGWGYITYRHGFQESSNTLMLTMLDELGTEKLKYGLEKFGFGKTTQSLFENESKGELSFSNKVSASTTVFGQGSTVTPIQMIQAETAILNEGNMLQPYYLQRIHDNKNNIDVNKGDKKVVGNPISKETAEKVKEELYGVVNGQWANGGKKYQLDGYNVSGKTGTAQLVDAKTGTYYTSPYKVMHSFIGYAPSENPEVILYTVIKLPKKNAVQNHANAVKELFNPIMTNTLDYLNIAKQKDSVQTTEYKIDNYLEIEINTAINNLSSKTKNIVVIGDGEKVIRQFPSEGNKLEKTDIVYLVTNTKNIIMPNMKSWSKADVIKFVELTGLNIEINGNGYVKDQSIPAGRLIKGDEKIKVKLT